MNLIKPIHTTGLFLYPTKTSVNQWLYVFSGYRKKMKWVNPLSANPTKWSNELQQFVGILPTNSLSVFDHFVRLVLKGLKSIIYRIQFTITKTITTIYDIRTVFKFSR